MFGESNLDLDKVIIIQWWWKRIQNYRRRQLTLKESLLRERVNKLSELQTVLERVILKDSFQTLVSHIGLISQKPALKCRAAISSEVISKKTTNIEQLFKIIIIQNKFRKIFQKRKQREKTSHLQISANNNIISNQKLTWADIDLPDPQNCFTIELSKKQWNDINQEEFSSHVTVLRNEKSSHMTLSEFSLTVKSDRKKWDEILMPSSIGMTVERMQKAGNERLTVQNFMVEPARKSWNEVVKPSSLGMTVERQQKAANEKSFEQNFTVKSAIPAWKLKSLAKEEEISLTVPSSRRSWNESNSYESSQLFIEKMKRTGNEISSEAEFTVNGFKQKWNDIIIHLSSEFTLEGILHPETDYNDMDFIIESNLAFERLKGKIEEITSCINTTKSRNFELPTPKRYTTIEKPWKPENMIENEICFSFLSSKPKYYEVEKKKRPSNINITGLTLSLPSSKKSWNETNRAQGAALTIDKIRKPPHVRANVVAITVSSCNVNCNETIPCRGSVLTIDEVRNPANVITKVEVLTVSSCKKSWNETNRPEGSALTIGKIRSKPRAKANEKTKTETETSRKPQGADEGALVGEQQQVMSPNIEDKNTKVIINDGSDKIICLQNSVDFAIIQGIPRKKKIPKFSVHLVEDFLIEQNKKRPIDDAFLDQKRKRLCDAVENCPCKCHNPMPIEENEEKKSLNILLKISKNEKTKEKEEKSIDILDQIHLVKPPKVNKILTNYRLQQIYKEVPLPNKTHIITKPDIEQIETFEVDLPKTPKERKSSAFNSPLTLQYASKLLRKSVAMKPGEEVVRNFDMERHVYNNPEVKK